MLFCGVCVILNNFSHFATWVFSPKKISIRRKNFWGPNKKRRKTTRHTMYSAMSSIPSGGPPGGTHTQELWYSLRGIDADLESVLSTDKCSCDACCSRFSTPIFVPFFSYFVPQKIFSANTNFFRRKPMSQKKFASSSSSKKISKRGVSVKYAATKNNDDDEYDGWWC